MIADYHLVRNNSEEQSQVMLFILTEEVIREQTDHFLHHLHAPMKKKTTPNYNTTPQHLVVHQNFKALQPAFILSAHTRSCLHDG